MASSLPYNHNLITGVDSIAVTNVPDSRGGANTGHVHQRVQTLQATLEFCLPNMGNNPFTQVSPYVCLQRSNWYSTHISGFPVYRHRSISRFLSLKMGPEENGAQRHRALPCSPSLQLAFPREVSGPVPPGPIHVSTIYSLRRQPRIQEPQGKLFSH